MSLIAHCPACDKRFRVPHADRTWSCKTCGGELELQAARATQSSRAKSDDCPECGAELASDAAFCEACGHAIHGSREGAQRAEAKVAGAEMRGAIKRVRTLNTFLWVALMFGALQLLFVVILAFSGELETGAIALLLGLVGTYCAANLFAIHQLERRPFPAIFLLALLRTLFTALELLGGQYNVLGLLFTVWVWSLLIPAAKLTRLAREHPELYISRRMRGDLERASEGMDSERSVVSRSKLRERDRSRSEAKRLVTIGVVLTAMIGAGLWGMLAVNRKNVAAAVSPVATLEEFRGAWNSADANAIGGFASGERVAKWTSNVEKLQRRYEWGDQLPQLDSFDVEQRGERRIAVDYEGPAGTLVANFTWVDERWNLTGLDLRDVKSWRP